MLVPVRRRPQRGGRVRDRRRSPGWVPAGVPRSRGGREGARGGAPRPGRTVERDRPGDPARRRDRGGSRRPSAGGPPRCRDPAQAPRARQPRARDRSDRPRRPGPRRADRPGAPRPRRIHRGGSGDPGGRDRTTDEVVPRGPPGAVVHGCDRRRGGRRHRDRRDRGGGVALGPRPGAARVVFATPVGPRSAPRLLESECDDAVVLETPPSFRAVGEWYERFDQVDDREVLDVLGVGP